MLWKAHDLEQFSLQAKDGKIGEITDLFVSDDNWIVRYLVVATEGWWERHEVLVSPIAFELPLNPVAKVIPVSITKEQIRNAPPVNTNEPVSRHYETRYYDHYGWPYYWVGGAGWGPFVAASDLARAAASKEGSVNPPPENPHLRSANELNRYRFEGRDGSLGHVEDLIISDENWSVRYLEIATRNWWPGGKKVLLATDWIRDVNWAARTLSADVARDAVKKAPEYDETAPITDEYESSLARHYGLASSVDAFR